MSPMPVMPFAEWSFSRLMLGTVQFGVNYGIANKAGQPSYETARDIIACAHEGGVNCLDTAAAYGASEEVIGRALTELRLKDRMTVVTKILLGEGLSGQAAEKAIEDSVARSLKRLRLDALPVCLFHHDGQFVFMDTLLRLKEKGLIRHVGVSVRNEAGPALAILKSGRAEALQLPINALDSRHWDGGVLALAARQGVALFARSVFLQGLLLMPETDIPEALAAVIPARRRLQALAAGAGMAMAEFAVRYVLALEGITSVLTGVESLAQMRENLALFSKPPLDDERVRNARAIGAGLPETILTPFFWPKKLVYR